MTTHSTEAAPPTSSGPWALLKESLSGDEDNLAKGPLPRAIPLLAIPMVLEMGMEALFSICDVFFVAQLGAAATAAVGLTEALLALVYAVAFGLAMPTAAMVARRIGEAEQEPAQGPADHADASQAAGQAVLLALGVGLAIALVAAPLSGWILAQMGAEPGVMKLGGTFAAISLASSPAVCLLFVQGAIFRGSGDARRAMRAMWLANGLNLVLDPLLIFGLGSIPGMGVTGAAVATAIGRGAGVVYQLWYLWDGAVIRIRDALRPVPAVIWRLARLSVGGTVQHLVETGAWVALVLIVADLGSSALAAYTITTRIIIFCLLPVWGFSNATATLVGQSLGAGDSARAERAVWLSGLYCTPVLAAITLIFIAAPEAVASGFSDDRAVVTATAQGLFVVGFGYVFYGWQMVTQQAFNGAGDTRTPAIVNTVSFWALQLPLAWALAHTLGFGVVGIFAAAACAYSFAAVLGVFLVRKGRWKGQAI